MASPVRFPEREAEEERRRRFNPDGTPIESGRDKFFRKMKEQPLVPIGSLLTCGALVMASHYLRVGNRQQFQRALRWRVGLQGLTVVGAVGGMLYVGSGGPVAASPSASSSSDPAAVGDPSSTLSQIATVPGRPATVHQAQRAEDRREAERQELRQRLAEAEARQEQEEKRRAEEVLLMGGKPSQRPRPAIGQDRRDRTQVA